MSVPQVVESYDDGTYMWQKGKEFACSWDGPWGVPVDPSMPGPRVVTPWLPTMGAARMAWEMNKPKQPELNHSFGWTDPRGVFGGSA